MEHLRALVDANAPLWAAETEVIRAYWDAPGRSLDADRRWVVRQAYKELFEGYLPSVRALAAGVARVDAVLPDASAARWLAVASDELAHFHVFRDLLVALGGEAPASLEGLRAEGQWPENAALIALRDAHCVADPRVGAWARRFTEGGYCALYREGMALAARGGRDVLIAAACARVYDDEIEHMGEALREIAAEALAPAEWDTLIAMSTAQCRQRVRMRHAQLGEPVSSERLEALLGGACAPQPFDWERVRLSA